MLKPKNLVLKIGGSMLPDKEAFERLAKSMLALKDRYDTVAIVISAMKDETDRLKEEAKELYTDPWRRLQYVAENGEFVSAMLMKDALKRAGENAIVVTQQEIEMKAVGDDPENCELLETNQELFDYHVRDAKFDHDFVVIPGYVAIHNEQESEGRPALAALGRNSTDLIAVEVAHLLNAPLYFVKSAPSVYAVDPRLVDNPKPISRMTHEQALRFLEYLPQDDQFVMRRAVEHAQDKEVELIFGSLGKEEGTRITVSSNGEGISRFAALPVKEKAAVIRFTTASNNKHRARMFEKIHNEGVQFFDKNEFEDFWVGRIHCELYVDEENRNALEKAIKPYASDRRVDVKDVALITLIDTSLDPESHHSSMVSDALANTDILYTARTSGTIMHIPVSPKDARKAVRLLAKKFALTQNAE